MGGEGGGEGLYAFLHRFKNVYNLCKIFSGPIIILNMRVIRASS